ncbi:TolC family protein [Variovorax sp. JS1663]|uniref:TolC family protein n=1 Tax=Variovorax sp. JS1663 TaxID=1851577 RepID=UPI000B346A33|nr:TolC family protein [Variovorax sp. JS1663]OUM02951.1 cobalt-zinc-cadmium resistance protein [Variovorax sp. JS1663]
MCRFPVPMALALMALASAGALAQNNPSADAVPQAAAPAAAPAASLTLAAAVALALDHSPELSAARREIEAAEGARIQAGVLPNPSLSVELEDTRRETRTTTVLLSQPIELGGKRGARIEAAERAIELARVQLEGREAELRASVTAAFFAALIAQDRVRLALASLALANTGSQAAGKRVSAGKISPVEETKAKVAEANVRLELVQAQGELRTSLQQLRAVTGAPTPIGGVDGDALAMPPLPPEALLEERLQRAPAMRQAGLDVQRLRALAELERAKRVPDITLTVGAKRPQEMARSQAVVGISVPLPIFDSNRGNLLEALRRQDKAGDEARALELRLRAEAGAALQRHNTARTEAAALQAEILPGAQSAFDAATKGFALGKFSYLEALDAQRTLLQARAQYLRALADAHRSITDLDRLLGGPDPTATASPISKERP